MKRVVFIILDGLGGLPVKELGGKTPLEAANTPFLDSLARKGVTGLINVLDGLAPESGAAMFALFGGEVSKYPGRSGLEALGLGVKLKKGEVCFRGNFATINYNYVIKDVRGGGVTNAENKALVKALNQVELSDARVRVIREEGYRFLAIFTPKKKIGFSGFVTNTHPGYKRLKNSFLSEAVSIKKNPRVKRCVALKNDESSVLTARVVNEFTRKASEVLRKHSLNKKRKVKVNAVLLRNASVKFSVPRNKLLRGWGCVTNRFLELGLSKYFGMTPLRFKKSFRNVEEECILKSRLVVKALKDYSGVYVYVKATDPLGHAGNCAQKKRMIELVDEFFFKNLVQGLEKKGLLKEALVVVSCDHRTPCKLKRHSSHPVPLLIYGAGGDGTERFSERECAKGSLGVLKSNEFMKKIKELSGLKN